DCMPGEKAIIGLRKRLWLKLACDDVEYVLEMAVDGEPLHHGVGVSAGAVGENELAAQQPFQCGAERRVRLGRRMIDLMDEIEKIVGIHPVLDHHAPHGGAVAAVEILLLAEGIVMSGAEELGDVVTNALVDLLPEIEVMRIEGVVEIEHPGIDVSK